MFQGCPSFVSLILYPCCPNMVFSLLMPKKCRIEIVSNGDVEELTKRKGRFLSLAISCSNLLTERLIMLMKTLITVSLEEIGVEVPKVRYWCT